MYFKKTCFETKTKKHLNCMKAQPCVSAVSNTFQFKFIYNDSCSNDSYSRHSESILLHMTFCRTFLNRLTFSFSYSKLRTMVQHLIQTFTRSFLVKKKKLILITNKARALLVRKSELLQLPL